MVWGVPGALAEGLAAAHSGTPALGSAPDPRVRPWGLCLGHMDGLGAQRVTQKGLRPHPPC